MLEVEKRFLDLSLSFFVSGSAEENIVTVVIGEFLEALIDERDTADFARRDRGLSVVDDPPRNALKIMEGGDVAVEEGFEALVSEGLEELVATPGEDEAEEVDRGDDTADEDRVGRPILL